MAGLQDPCASPARRAESAESAAGWSGLGHQRHLGIWIDKLCVVRICPPLSLVCCLSVLGCNKMEPRIPSMAVEDGGTNAGYSEYGIL